MKRVFLVLMVIITVSLTGCVSAPITEAGEMKIGYSGGAGDSMDFPGFLAFTISNSSLEVEESTNILFEYGHDFNQVHYDVFDKTFSLAVFVSESHANTYRDNGEFTLLYEEMLDDFVTDDYLCEVDNSNIFDVPEFNKSFELTVSSEDIPYEIGILYYTLSFDDLTPDMESITYIVQRGIYFTNYDGVLIFTEDNPN